MDLGVDLPEEEAVRVDRLRGPPNLWFIETPGDIVAAATAPVPGPQFNSLLTSWIMRYKSYRLSELVMAGGILEVVDNSMSLNLEGTNIVDETLLTAFSNLSIAEKIECLEQLAELVTRDRLSFILT